MDGDGFSVVYTVLGSLSLPAKVIANDILFIFMAPILRETISRTYSFSSNETKRENVNLARKIGTLSLQHSSCGRSLSFCLTDESDDCAKSSPFADRRHFAPPLDARGYDLIHFLVQLFFCDILERLSTPSGRPNEDIDIFSLL